MNLNAATELLAPNLVGNRGERVAFVDKDGSHSFADVAMLASQFAGLLVGMGFKPGQRILLAAHDTVAFPISFLGAMQVGVVPVPLNTLMVEDDYAFIAQDCDAAGIVASEALLGKFPQELGTKIALFEEQSPQQKAGREDNNEERGEWHDFWRSIRSSSGIAQANIPVTAANDVAFLLYTSGTTGHPKGVLHSHADLLATAERYGQGVLAIAETDVIYSAAKFFFAYGLGNSFTFPLSAGATVILLEGPPTPEAVLEIFDAHRPTIFFGVPTLYAMLLNTGSIPRKHRLRHCVSAGEALPQAILEKWHEATGVEILDGIGSTEMLHIYMSNLVGAVEPGTSGVPLQGYAVKLLDESGVEIGADGEIGDLYASGPSLTSGYWNRDELNQQTFAQGWMRTGDKYQRTSSGAYTYCGRSDDLLKVGGIYVSPMEVENILMQHPSVAEAAVVGHKDDDELVKPRAFVVLSGGVKEAEGLEQALVDHVASCLASYKRPRWVEFVTELPKTATGKIQRFKLRIKSEQT